MFSKFLAAAVLAASFGMTWAAEDAQVTIKGVLLEDKNGFYVRANGGTFDLYFSEEGREDLRKFHKGLEGDMVQVSGSLQVREDKGHTFLMVYANDISRLKGEHVVVRETPPVVVSPPPVVVRERYVERDHVGIHLPGIHIHW